MLDYSKEKLVELGAEITTREIYQQPDVWQTAFNHYKDQADQVAAFLKGIESYLYRCGNFGLCRRYAIAIFQKAL